MGQARKGSRPGKGKATWLFNIEEVTKVLREHAEEITRKKKFKLETVPLTRERIAEITREVRRKHAEKMRAK